MKGDGRMRKLAGKSFRCEIPTELAVADFDVGRERNKKPVGHGVDERRAALHRLGLAAHRQVEGLGRHGFEPFRKPLHRRHRSRQHFVEARGAPKRQRHALSLIHNQVPLLPNDAPLLDGTTLVPRGILYSKRIRQ